MTEPKRLGDLLGLAIEDLKAIEDMVDRNERSPAFQRRELARAQAKLDEEFDLDQSMAEKALKGVYGSRCKRIAEDFLAGTARTPATLLELRKRLAKVEGRTSG